MADGQGVASITCFNSNLAIWFIDKWSDQSNRALGKIHWRHKGLQLGKNCQNLSRFWLGSKLGQKIRSSRKRFLFFPFLRKWIYQNEMNNQTENGHGNMTEVGQLKGPGLETHLVTNSQVALPTSLNGIASTSQLALLPGIISKSESSIMIQTYGRQDKSYSLAPFISRFCQLRNFRIE